MAAAQHLFSRNIRGDAIQSAREFRKVAGGHGREEVVFGVKEHGIGDSIQPRAPLRPAWLMSGATVVHGPYGEKSGQALASQHCPYMPFHWVPGAKA